MLAYGCAWVRAASRWLRHPLTHSARGGVLKVSGRGTSFFTPCLWQVEQGTKWAWQRLNIITLDVKAKTSYTDKHNDRQLSRQKYGCIL
jgi:hypothetical protein